MSLEAVNWDCRQPETMPQRLLCGNSCTRETESGAVLKGVLGVGTERLADLPTPNSASPSSPMPWSAHLCSSYQGLVSETRLGIPCRPHSPHPGSSPRELGGYSQRWRQH